MPKELFQALLEFVKSGPGFLTAVIAIVLFLYLVAKTLNPIIDLFQKLGLWPKKNEPSSIAVDSAVERIKAIREGLLTPCSLAEEKT